MELATIKKTSIVCLQRIRNKCDQLSRSLSEHLVRMQDTEQRRNSTCDSENAQFLLKDTYYGKRSFTTSKKNNVSLIASQIKIPKNYREIIDRRKQKNDLLESVHISKKNKHTFFKIIEKFQKCYHPTNASKGQNSSLNNVSGLSNSRKNCSQYTSTIKQKQDKYESNQMKRLSILNRVIAENNRKERRIQKQKSRHSKLQF